jgi:hypothetical protein
MEKFLFVSTLSERHQIFLPEPEPHKLVSATLLFITDIISGFLKLLCVCYLPVYFGYFASHSTWFGLVLVCRHSVLSRRRQSIITSSESTASSSISPISGLTTMLRDPDPTPQFWDPDPESFFVHSLVSSCNQNIKRFC